MPDRKIRVRVKPGSKISKIEPPASEEASWIVRVKSRAQEGKANKELILLLAQYFKVKKSSITILSGHKSRDKWILVKEKSKG